MAQTKDMQQWDTAAVFANLANYGVKIDERIFIKMAKKYQSPAAVAKAWKLNKLADAAEIVQMAGILWDRLCPDLFGTNGIRTLIRRGYDVMEERNEAHRQFFDHKRRNFADVTEDDDRAAKEQYDERTVAITTAWLEAWTRLRDVAVAQSVRSADHLDSLIPKDDDGLEPLESWLVDLQMELENLSWAERPDKPTRSTKVFTVPMYWAEKRLAFVRDVMKILPQSDNDRIFNSRRDEADALFLLGQTEQGDALYAKLVNDYPHNAWAYIGWGDAYSPRFCALASGPDQERARDIYEQGLRVVEDEREELEERISLLQMDEDER